jgi:glyoxylase-like metal-dependent hydrolase (beta-lactamase superfamily II)
VRVGDIELQPVSDGAFVARPPYFATDAPADAHPELFDRHGAAWLPIGCFLVRSGARTVLVDAGLGPTSTELPHGMQLVGGQLLTGLRAIGVALEDITDVACTHLHSDHVGWLFDLDARPVFPNATIHFGAADWAHFVDGDAEMAPHIRHGLKDADARVRTLAADATIAPGVNVQLAPGHTPGHLCVVLSSGTDRALLLGDAITCPVQLDEPAWHSMADVDPALAARTRERLWRELEDPLTLGAGAHFPELRFGRVLEGTARRWLD